MVHRSVTQAPGIYKNSEPENVFSAPFSFKKTTPPLTWHKFARNNRFPLDATPSHVIYGNP